MATSEVAGDYPCDLREMIVYEALLRVWGRVILDSEQLEPFALARSLEYGHHISADRMLDLNWAAYRDINTISELQGYPAKHAIFD